MTLRFSASATFLYGGMSAADTVRHAVDAGFAALEFQRLRHGEAEAYAAAVEQAALPVALMNLDVGDFASPGPGLSGVPARAAEFRAALDRGRDDARSLRARVVHIGPSRVPAGTSRADCLAQLVSNVRMSRDALAPLGIRVALEALNRRDYPDILIGSPEEAIEVIDEVGDEGVGLQYDIYHAAVAGRNVDADLRRLGPQLAHVQFADHPGRHEPGSGALPLAAFFSTLDATGYAGFVGAEYSPSSTLDAAVAWLRRYRAPLLPY